MVVGERGVRWLREDGIGRRGNDVKERKSEKEEETQAGKARR